MPLNVNTNKGVPITRNFTSNEYELLADYTVSGSAITSYTFSGLNINADEEIVLEINLIGSSTISAAYIYVNGNTTNTNYYNQSIYASSTSVGCSRANSPVVSYAPYPNTSFTSCSIKLANNGYFIWQSNMSYLIGSSTIEIDDYYGSSTFTLSQITSLTITAQNASGIGIGSRFQLYKVKGQVQQTWATT